MFIFLILIIFFSFCKIYDKDSIKLIKYGLNNIRWIYILICLIVIFGYFLLQGIYMKTILAALKYKISLKKGIFYSLVEFCFSGITPSSTGGQPMQLYYMTKDKIPIRKSYITLVLNTIYFKLIILILGILVLLFKSSYIFSSQFIYIFFFLLGFIVDLLIVILGFILIFKYKVIKKILVKILSIGNKFEFLKKRIANFNIDEFIRRYRDELNFISNHKTIVAVNFILTFIQRLLLFSITYIIYRAMGLSEYNFVDLLLIQVSVQVAVEALPIPGGAGLSEGMFYNLFGVVFVSKFADIAMLLVRTFSFYIPLLISLIVVIIYSLFYMRKSIK